MLALNDLKDVSRPHKRRKRVGRGIGSGVGKTCGRGEKGAGARAGYKRREGYEGGQMRLFMKLPIRGFSNFRFRRALHTINISDIENTYENGEIVNLDTLAERGFIKGHTYGVKVLANGEITKSVSIEMDAITLSKGARDKLQKAKIELKHQ